MQLSLFSSDQEPEMSLVSIPASKVRAKTDPDEFNASAPGKSTQGPAGPPSPGENRAYCQRESRISLSEESEKVPLATWQNSGCKVGVSHLFFRFPPHFISGRLITEKFEREPSRLWEVSWEGWWSNAPHPPPPPLASVLRGWGISRSERLLDFLVELKPHQTSGPYL